MKKLAFFALLLAAAPSLCAAPEAPQTLTVRALTFQPGFPDELHAHTPEGTATAGLFQIKSYLNHESNLLTIKGKHLVFTAKSSPSSATDVNLVYGQLEVPATMKSAILLFLPESDAPENHKCQVMAIDDSPKEFPAGSFKVSNFSESPVKIELEEEATEIAPGESKVITKVKYGENQSASMRAFTKRDDQWVMISTSSWPNPGSKRVLQIFYKDLATKEVQLRGVRDVGLR